MRGSFLASAFGCAQLRDPDARIRPHRVGASRGTTLTGAKAACNNPSSRRPKRRHRKELEGYLAERPGRHYAQESWGPHCPTWGDLSSFLSFRLRMHCDYLPMCHNQKSREDAKPAGSAIPNREKEWALRRVSGVSGVFSCRPTCVGVHPPAEPVERNYSVGPLFRPGALRTSREAAGTVEGGRCGRMPCEFSWDGCGPPADLHAVWEQDVSTT
jgi:hypothetical protein